MSGMITIRNIVVDLDGTVLRSDMLAESFAQVLGRNPWEAASALAELRGGRAALKAALADRASMDVSRLPYNRAVLDWLREAKANGARLYLASASDSRFVEEIAGHLAIFDGWIGSTHEVNMAGEAKASRIEALLDGQPFAYVGNSKDDLPVWRKAAQCLSVDCPPGVRRKLNAFAPGAEAIGGHRRFDLRAWADLLRVRQYVKNSLVAVPMIVSHQITGGNLWLILLAAIAFSLCASAVYVLNDIVDLDADRQHPRKRLRPLAAGTVSILAAPFVALALLAAAFGLALAVGVPFALMLLFYLALTTAYTFSLKRKMIVDGITLALLYTCRVIAGGVAIDVMPSEWLLGFSLFIFASLAFTKRLIELVAHPGGDGETRLANRNYQLSDRNVVVAIAAACGFNAVTFMALYITSEAVHKLYARPQFLWIACPILMYWIGRNILLAQRGLMQDDPIVFALTDVPSLMAGGLIAAAAVLATI